MKNLQLYTASAGSGKTYQLALNYICELFSDPNAYRHILAVTFTNKAAAEMKRRILEKLFQLSREMDEAGGYADYLIENEIVKDKEELKQISASLLQNILHDYSSFYVQTIDKFFQWVIRGFTREIGLQNGYNLELDSSVVLSEAVDLLIWSMEEDEQLKSWLIRFAEDKINEGKSWDFYKDVYMLGREVFKESYQSVQEETGNHEERNKKFDTLRKKLNTAIRNFEISIKSRGQKALEMIDRAGLQVQDFKGGRRGVATIFTKAALKPVTDFNPSDTNRNGALDFSYWIKKNDPRESEILSLYEGGLQSLITEILDIWDNQKGSYFTALALKNNIYSFGILNDISDRIREITRDKNLFLISDSSMFLKKITGENDAPFIFEKAGNYFSNYMLDEFQDTSRFQWDNFLPLIENGLSTGKNSVVVGDVKQSIYRWRNSDWKILAAELTDKIGPDRIHNISLDTNYRSAKNIIAFNNSVFHAAPAVIKELMVDRLSGEDLPGFENYWLELMDRVYGEPRQKFFKGLMGVDSYITHRFLPPVNKSERLEFIEEWLPGLIRDLQDRNYRAGDITILVRTRTEGREIARILMDQSITSEKEYNFNVISNDSLFLANNSAVRFLTALLKFFNQSHDRLNISYIKHEYLYSLREKPEEEVDWHKVFCEGSSGSESDPLDHSFQLFEKEIPRLRKLPLYDLTEALIGIFKLNQNEDKIAYVQAFQDVVLEFIRKETSDISAFLSYWENASASATLNVSETQDALRIMTMHKAKGLEFRVVIIPFCDWNLEPDITGNRKTPLWPSTDGTEFGEFSHMPVMYGKQMRESLFKKDYYEEMFRTFVDNLNLLYVAFTRAGRELHVCSKTGDKKGNVKNVGDLVLKILMDAPDSNDQSDYPAADLRSGFDRENRIFSYGTPELFVPPSAEAKDITTQILTEYPVTETTTKLALNHKNIYLSDLKEDEKGYTGYGTQMHEILAGIEEYKDIPYAVRNAWLKGLLSTQERDDLQKELSDLLLTEPFEDWFSGHWQCRLEADIMTSGGEILRPDRVMIREDTAIILDYKFGNEKKAAYKEQLRRYYEALRSAGYENIKLYLWYYSLNETEEVKI